MWLVPSSIFPLLHVVFCCFITFHVLLCLFSSEHLVSHWKWRNLDVTMVSVIFATSKSKSWRSPNGKRWEPMLVFQPLKIKGFTISWFTYGFTLFTLPLYEVKKVKGSAVAGYQTYEDENIPSTLNGVLTAHTEWLVGVYWGIQYHLCSTYKVLCWWLSGCRGSVAEQCMVAQSHRCSGFDSQVATVGIFTFLCFCLITSKFLFTELQQMKFTLHTILGCYTASHIYTKVGQMRLISVSLSLFVAYE